VGTVCIVLDVLFLLWLRRKPNLPAQVRPRTGAPGSSTSRASGARPIGMWTSCRVRSEDKVRVVAAHTKGGESYSRSFQQSGARSKTKGESIISVQGMTYKNTFGHSRSRRSTFRQGRHRQPSSKFPGSRHSRGKLLGSRRSPSMISTVNGSSWTVPSPEVPHPSHASKEQRDTKAWFAQNHGKQE
jgi:hypothetical protein